MRKKKMELIANGFNFLRSYFSDDISKEAVEEKITNISGKTGKYFVPMTLYQKRTSRSNRALIPFEHINDNNITYEQLQTFTSGVTVEFVNNDYFEQLELNEAKQNDVFKRLKDKLGCDEQVSAMIDIRSTGSSSSQVQREALDRLEKFIQSRGEDLKDVLIQRKVAGKASGKGNDVWKGYVYYHISGGQQSSRDSHKENGIESKNVQLFNPSVEYADDRVADDITLVLLYFAFHSIPVKDRDEKWNDMIDKYRSELKDRVYDTGSLLDYVTSHISLNIEKDVLYDPISVEPINLELFVEKERTDNSLDITHQEAVNQHSYVYDNHQKKLLTAARPANLFWSTHLSNMMQQNFSLADYYRNQIEIVKKWDKYDVRKLLKESH